MAIAAGEKWYFTGRPCKHGHIALRQVSNKRCRECSRLGFAEWERANLAIRAEDKRRARAEGRVGPRARDPKNAARAKVRYLAKKPEYIAANRKRLADKERRTPPWADLELIKDFYALAAIATKATGIEFHVDHVVPLRGKLVSGLHVPANFALLTREQNMAKHNKWAV